MFDGEGRGGSRELMVDRPPDGTEHPRRHHPVISSETEIYTCYLCTTIYHIYVPYLPSSTTFFSLRDLFPEEASRPTVIASEWQLDHPSSLSLGYRVFYPSLLAGLLMYPRWTSVPMARKRYYWCHASKDDKHLFDGDADDVQDGGWGC